MHMFNSLKKKNGNGCKDIKEDMWNDENHLRMQKNLREIVLRD